MDWLLPPPPSADWPMFLQILYWFAYGIAYSGALGLVSGMLTNWWLRRKEHKAEAEYVKKFAEKPYWSKDGWHKKSALGQQPVDITIDKYGDHPFIAGHKCSLKSESPMTNLHVINSYALAPMEAKDYPQWVGLVMAPPGQNKAMIGVMTTGGMWAKTGSYSECSAGMGSMIKAEMAPKQYVVVLAGKELSYLGKWMSEIAPTLFGLNAPQKVSSTDTMLTLPPAHGVADLKTVNDAEAVGLWAKGSSSTITTALTNIPVKFEVEQTPWVSGTSAMDYVQKLAEATYLQKPPPATLTETELVPDVACHNGCGHRLTSHVQNKPGESGSCVIPGCTCEQWRNVCAECGVVSYPWRYVHSAACKNGQNIRQLLAARAELEQNEKRNRRARTSIEQIPEEF